MQDEIARVSRLSWRNGDGYSWGGEVILTIGDRAIMLGAGHQEMEFARELALAWNRRAAQDKEGWRYTAARQLAEAGCSDAEIQSVTGHKTLSMVQKYRAQANQKRASKAAQSRREQNKDGT